MTIKFDHQPPDFPPNDESSGRIDRPMACPRRCGGPGLSFFMHGGAGDCHGLKEWMDSLHAHRFCVRCGFETMNVAAETSFDASYAASVRVARRAGAP